MVVLNLIKVLSKLNSMLRRMPLEQILKMMMMKMKRNTIWKKKMKMRMMRKTLMSQLLNK